MGKMRVVSVDLIEKEARYLRLMAYGQPGTGKTWFGASAGLDKLTAPCLFIEYKSQIASLRGSPEVLAAIERKDLIILRLSCYDDLSFIYTFLKTGKQAQLSKMFGGVMPASVVLDSLTELQRTEVMRRAGNPENRFLTDVMAPQIGNWGELLNQFALLARLFYDTDLECHMVFLALEQTEYRKVKGELEPQVAGYCPALQGQARDQFPAQALTLMRFVRAARNAKHHNIGITRAAKTASKEQTNAFPEKIEGPTIPLMVRLLNKSLAKAAQARKAEEAENNKT